MIKLENTEVLGWEHAIRGMRNPMNSWEKNDSGIWTSMPDTDDPTKGYDIGPNDHKLMMSLAAGGPVHAKYRRMIAVYVDITAPLYWWKEFDTYKVGTVANSCSTMHKIHEKEFTLDDFSCEHLIGDITEDFDDISKEKIQGVTFYTNDESGQIGLVCTDIYSENEIRQNTLIVSQKEILQLTIDALNANRAAYLETKDKKYWWQMIQLLPSSYNQRRTVMLNYEVLTGIYPMRKNHKLDEWREFCQWIEKLPYSEIITCSVKGEKSDEL